jgi:hypothetical protein
MEGVFVYGSPASRPEVGDLLGVEAAFAGEPVMAAELKATPPTPVVPSDRRLILPA